MIIVERGLGLPVIGEEGEVGGEEEHVLGVAGGPSVGVACLEEEAVHLGPGLLDGLLDEFVDDLGDHQAQGEEHRLELAPEYEVGCEPAQGDEHRDERDPRQEVAQLVALLVPDVG